MTEAPQAFVRAIDPRRPTDAMRGMTAELMIPKWFDKSPEQVERARTSTTCAPRWRCARRRIVVELARREPRSATPSFHYRALLDQGARAAPAIR